MKRIYLCSRVSEDAREMNEHVAGALERAGYLVYVPHRQSINNNAGSSAQEIFEQDMSAMQKSDAVVVVGKNGTDCSMEIGWFLGRGLPAFWFSPPQTFQPMFWPVLSSHSYHNVYALIDALDKQFNVEPEKSVGPTLLSKLMRFAP